MKITMIKNNKENLENIVILRIGLEKILQILNSVKGEDTLIADESLNFYYSKLTFLVDEILKKDGFEMFTECLSALPKNIVTELGFIDSHWDVINKQISECLSSIQKEIMFIELQEPSFSKENSDFFSDLELAIDNHIKNNKLQTEKLNEKKISMGNWMKEARFNQRTTQVFEWITKNEKSAYLVINGKQRIDFDGEQIISIIDFFYKNRGSDWMDYDEIKKDTINQNTEYIRHTIDDINKRVRLATNSEIEKIIEDDQTYKNSKNPKRYRWI